MSNFIWFLFLIFFPYFNYAQEVINKDHKNWAIIMLGPPGSGKGVQSSLLSKQLNLPHVDVGALLREAINKNTELAGEIKSYVSNGQLVPTEVVLKIIFNRIDQADCSNGFVIDGSSRNLELANALCCHIESQFNFFAILLSVPDKVLIDRVQSRRVCQRCNISYNTLTIESACKSCGNALCRRSDDNIEIFEGRLKRYHEETENVHQFYANQNKLIVVNGDQDSTSVNKNIINEIRF